MRELAAYMNEKNNNINYFKTIPEGYGYTQSNRIFLILLMIYSSAQTDAPDPGS